MKKSIVALTLILIIGSNQQATTPIGKDPCSPLVKEEIKKHDHLLRQAQQKQTESLIKNLEESSANLEALLKKREDLEALIKEREKQEISEDLKNRMAVNKKLINHDKAAIWMALGASASYLEERAEHIKQLNRFIFSSSQEK
jgi:hypothetical protein